MRKPTVNDIAREAGVSLATVDRVLNARPGVRARTVAAVNDAVVRLGYVRDIAAANLARQRTYRFAAAIPTTASQFDQAIAAALEEAALLAVSSRLELNLLRFPPEDMHALAAMLAALPPGTDGVALMAPETPVLRDAVNALGARGVPVVTLVSDLPNTGRSHFVGIDSRAAGRTAGLLIGRFLGGRPGGRVLVVGQSMLLRDSIERRRGFDEILRSDFPGIEALQTIETHGSAAALERALAEFMGHSGPPDGIYLLGSGARALAALLDQHDLGTRPVLIGHELTPFTRAGLLSGRFDAIVSQNLGHVARSALRVLRALADRSPIDFGQERLRIEIVTRENLPDDGPTRTEVVAV